MQPPSGVKTYESGNSTYWFDEDGILYSISKAESEPLEQEKSTQVFEAFLEKHGGKRFCMLIDAKFAKPTSKEQRQHTARLLPKVVKAMAVVVHNPLGRMMVNLFVGLQKPPYPMKIFSPGEEDRAREWLLQFKDE